MTAIYTGSFDPVTRGHIDIAKRAAKLTDNLIVALLNNPAKKSLFSVNERLSFLQHELSGINNIKIESFSGILAAYAYKKNAAAIIRGVRNSTDFEYEATMAFYNKMFSQETNENNKNGLDTIFLLSDPAYTYVSCSAVKEAAKLVCENNFNDNALHAMVTPYVLTALKNAYSSPNLRKGE